MLVLKRKAGESVWIVVPGAAPIQISVERVGTLVVTLGIHAPREVGLGRDLDAALARAGSSPNPGRFADRT